MDEYFAPDEVFFFLHCRNFIMRGPSSNRTSTFCRLIDRVKFDRVQDLILKQFFAPDDERFSAVMSKLEKQVVLHEKSRVRLIDINYACRIILELFVLDKRTWLKSFESRFNSMSKITTTAEPNILPKDFFYLMRRELPYLDMLQLAELFRETWSLGQGACNFKGLVAALNSLGFLIARAKTTCATMNSHTAGVSSIILTSKSKSCDFKAVSHQPMQQRTNREFAQMLDKHSVQVQKLCSSLKSSFDPRLNAVADQLLDLLQAGPNSEAKADLIFVGDPLNLLLDAFVSLIGYIRVVRCSEFVSGCDDDHLFKQSTDSSRKLIKGIDAFLQHVNFHGYDHEKHLSYQIKKIQAVTIQMIYQRAKDISNSLQQAKEKKLSVSKRTIKKKT